MSNSTPNVTPFTFTPKQQEAFKTFHKHSQSCDSCKKNQCPEGTRSFFELVNTFPYLAVKNFEDKYGAGEVKQGTSKGKTIRAWRKTYIDGSDLPERFDLSVYQRHMLDECINLRARLGHNLPNDLTYITRAASVLPTERGRCAHALRSLVTRQLLAPSNQQLGFQHLYSYFDSYLEYNSNSHSDSHSHSDSDLGAKNTNRAGNSGDVVIPPAEPSATPTSLPAAQEKAPAPPLAAPLPIRHEHKSASSGSNRTPVANSEVDLTKEQHEYLNRWDRAAGTGQ